MLKRAPKRYLFGKMGAGVMPMLMIMGFITPTGMKFFPQMLLRPGCYKWVDNIGSSAYQGVAA